MQLRCDERVKELEMKFEDDQDRVQDLETLN